MSTTASSLSAPGGAAATGPASLLGVQAGAGYWLLRLEDAGEILAVPDLASVPLTQPWYLGLASVRGNLVSVVDFALFAGGQPGARGGEARVVLVSDRYRCYCALLVQRLLGLKDLRKMTPLGSGPGADAKAVAWIGAHHRDEAGTLWRELDVPALVRDEAFLRAGL